LDIKELRKDCQRDTVALHFATCEQFGTLRPMPQPAQRKSAAVARRTARPPAVSDRDADATRADILSVATEEFASKGLSGSRVDEIAERTHTVKRMIYYYFESKEGLYRAVLERAYDHIRTIESNLELDSLPPLEALRQLVRVTFDYHNKHPEFVRLVMNENIHKGAHVGHLANIKERNRTVIATLRRLLDRGMKSGDFRADIDPIELHMSISALCFYNVSNRYTFSTIFGRDMTSPKAAAARREVIAEIIEKWCRRER
jgi:AcrR family transcriptional regulator